MSIIISLPEWAPPPRTHPLEKHLQRTCKRLFRLQMRRMPEQCPRIHPSRVADISVKAIAGPHTSSVERPSQ
eukprot:5724513-Alexandrium_andersonii.AAC.1